MWPVVNFEDYESLWVEFYLSRYKLQPDIKKIQSRLESIIKYLDFYRGILHICHLSRGHFLKHLAPATGAESENALRL